MSKKILVLGYGRHGKDTFTELLADKYGVKFSSSSWMAAKIFLYEKLKGVFGYENIDQCYDDRHNHRKLWFDEITNFNTPDKTKLAKEIMKENDIYVGMRNVDEFLQCQKDKVFDVVVWVDASDRVEYKESSESCNVTPVLADYIINNNGTLSDLDREVTLFWEKINE